MKKIIQKIILALVPLAFFMGMTISADAMSKEEQELFDMLGVKYSVDANGEFKEFLVSEKDPRITQDQIMELSKKYKGGQKVGNYSISVGANPETGILSFHISDQDGNMVCGSNGYYTEFMHPDQSFYRFDYQNPSAKEAYYYTKGSLVKNEAGYNSFEEYKLNEKGEYILVYKRDDMVHYTYILGYTFKKTYGRGASGICF